MKRHFYLLTILSVSATFHIRAQKKTDHNQQAELALKKANKLFDNEKYLKATEMYKDLLGTVASGQLQFTDKKHALDAHVRLGLCYLYGEHQSLALQPLKQATRISADYSPLLDFHLGDAFVYNRKYYDAVQSYQSGIDKSKKINKRYLSLVHDVISKEDFIKVSNKRIKEANYAKGLMKNPLRAKIHNLGPNINTKDNEYGPIVTEDNSMLIFTGSQANRKQEDVLVSYTKERQWNAKKPWHHFSSKRHESAVFLSLDGHHILIYQDRGGGNLYESSININTKSTTTVSSITGVKKSKKRRRSGNSSNNSKNRKKSRIVDKTKEVWTKPKSLGKHVNSKHRETSGCLSPDGKTLYFTSDRPGGLGGFDIYASTKDKKGRWGKPTNLGAKINTPYDEEAPFMHLDGKTLYFSSEGHNSIGGFDIFKATLVGENTWSNAENLGVPINSQSNDMFFVSNDKNHRIAYFSSDRPGGVGGKDLYRVIMNPSSKKALAKGDLLSFRVFFMYKDTQIPKKSIPAVESVLVFLKNNPGITIEISGHTDDVGSRKNNIALSKKRAEVVYNWLISNGVAKERLVKKGYGSKVPVIPNETHYARILNRRTDFRVVSVSQQ